MAGRPCLFTQAHTTLHVRGCQELIAERALLSMGYVSTPHTGWCSFTGCQNTKPVFFYWVLEHQASLLLLNTKPVFFYLMLKHQASLLLLGVQTPSQSSFTGRQNTKPVFFHWVLEHQASVLLLGVRTSSQCSFTGCQNIQPVFFYWVLEYPVFFHWVLEHPASLLSLGVRTPSQCSFTGCQNTQPAFCHWVLVITKSKCTQTDNCQSHYRLAQISFLKSTPGKVSALTMSDRQNKKRKTSRATKSKREWRHESTDCVNISPSAPLHIDTYPE